MTPDPSPLFQPLTIAGQALRNRIVMPPMVTVRRITSQDGIEWYGERARGGAGLVIVEATAVNGFGSDLTPATLKPLVDAIHDRGALAAIQLFPVSLGRSVSPAGVSRHEIEEIISLYSTAAEVCAQAGFDGVEPHGAHGYLINQFFSPVQNQRTDEFGGEIEDRMRFALSIVDATRRAAGHMMLLYRHTPVGEGYGIQESLVLADELVKAGVHVLDISPASADAPGDRAAPFKRLGVPVIAVNELDEVERALEVLDQDRADLVAVGRGLIADPEWPAKVRDGRFDDIVKCIRCNEMCYGNLSKRIPIACTQWGGS